MTPTNRIVKNAVSAPHADNMSAQQAVTLIEMEMDRGDDEAENLLDMYGRLIRRELGDRVYRDLYERATAFNSEED